MLSAPCAGPVTTTGANPGWRALRSLASASITSGASSAVVTASSVVCGTPGAGHGWSGGCSALQSIAEADQVERQVDRRAGGDAGEIDEIGAAAVSVGDRADAGSLELAAVRLPVERGIALREAGAAQSDSPVLASSSATSKASSGP